MIDPKFVGRTYEAVKYEVGLEKIKEYASATGDTNPIYLDEEAAAKGPYGSIVAPPMFAVVYCKDIVGKVLFDNEVDLNMMMLVHGEQEFEFHRPVRPREVVYTDGEIMSIENKEKLDVITYRTNSRVEGELVTTGIYTFVIRK